MEIQKGSKETQVVSGVKFILELSKNERPQAAMSSAAQLLKSLTEESL